MRARRVLPLLPAVCVVLAAALPALAQVVVQRVDVQVVIEEPAPHPLIRDRLTATVQSVTDRLLLGRPLEQLQPAQPRLGETIAGVVDRVATGYAVAEISVHLDVTAQVTARLRPLAPVVREVRVTPDLRTVHPRLHALVTALLLQGPAPEIRALYTGLPAGAMEWAEPFLETHARDAVESGLPGFTAAVRVRVRGEQADAEVALLPRDTRVVRNIGVRFRSSSIPTLLLDQHGPAVASMAEPLRGLPVDFAQAQRDAIARQITADLAAYPPARQYRVIASAVLDVGETTYVTVIAESVLYRARVEAQLNVGVQAPGPAIVAHVGRLVAPHAEGFVDVRLVPNTLSFEWALGAQYALSPSATVGASYAVVAGETTLWTSVQIGQDTGVRAAWNARTQSMEGALTYRINEFLAGEIVGTSQGDWWLRLISNL